jgi:hypothetical protein
LAGGRHRHPVRHEIYQAYLEANEMFGYPIWLRIGRQELVLGGGWLVVNNQSHVEFPGLSFDGVRVTLATDPFSVDAFDTRLSVELGVNVAYLEALETFDQPYFVSVGEFRLPLVPALSFWITGIEDELAIETGLWVRYHYTEDLIFELGWSSPVHRRWG